MLVFVIISFLLLEKEDKKKIMLKLKLSDKIKYKIVSLFKSNN